MSSFAESRPSSFTSSSSSKSSQSQSSAIASIPVAAFSCRCLAPSLNAAAAALPDVKNLINSFSSIPYRHAMQSKWLTDSAESAISIVKDNVKRQLALELTCTRVACGDRVQEGGLLEATPRQMHKCMGSTDLRGHHPCPWLGKHARTLHAPGQ